MKPSLLLIIIVFFSSFILTWLVRYVALRRSLIDIPNERSSHTVPKPRGGGIAIVITWFICVVFLFIHHDIQRGLFLALLCGLPVSLIGFLDDILKIEPRIRFLIQISAAAGAVLFLGGLSHIDLGFTTISLPVVLSILAVVGIVWSTNLFNFLDGIDGYASTEMIFIGLSAFLLMGSVPPLYLAAIAAGFLIWNWQPAKIFMGDVSSTLLGFNIGIFAVYYQNTGTASILIWIILYAIFWIDATITLYRRFKNREHLTQAHRKHAYQRIVQAGFSHQKTVLFSVILNLAGALMALLSVKYPPLIILFLLAYTGFLLLVLRYIDKRYPFLPD